MSYLGEHCFTSTWRSRHKDVAIETFVGLRVAGGNSNLSQLSLKRWLKETISMLYLEMSISCEVNLLF